MSNQMPRARRARQKAWRLVVCGTTATAVVGLSACASSSGSSGGAQGGRITIGQPLESPLYVATYTALAKGFLKEKGVDATLRIVSGDPVVASALVSGSIDVASTSSNWALELKKSGSPGLAIANTVDGPVSRIIVSKSVLAQHGLSVPLLDGAADEDERPPERPATGRCYRDVARCRLSTSVRDA